jgi:hypothetical protein
MQCDDWCEFNDVPEVLAVLMKDTESTSETSVNFYQNTRRNIPENSYPQTFHRKDLKTYLVQITKPVTTQFLPSFS